MLIRRDLFLTFCYLFSIYLTAFCPSIPVLLFSFLFLFWCFQDVFFVFRKFDYVSMWVSGFSFGVFWASWMFEFMSLIKFGIVSFILFGHSNRCVMASYCFNLQFSNDTRCWASFHMLICHPYISMFRSFAPETCHYLHLCFFYSSGHSCSNLSWTQPDTLKYDC